MKKRKKEKKKKQDKWKKIKIEGKNNSKEYLSNSSLPKEKNYTSAT